jgi:ornithine cyclodeaminase/alanine dehydrogenase-like protein (mu-crystallin family)
VNVYSPTPKNREAFAKEWNDKLDPLVVPVDEPTKAISGTNILACASNAMKPIFDASWIEPEMHVSAIKNPEIPGEAFSKVDRVAVATTQLPSGPHNYAPRSSDFAQNLTDKWAISNFDISAAQDISSLISENRDPISEETTLFLNNTGIGMQFAAVGKVAYDHAIENGLGTEVDTNLFLQSVW